jgi:hypothetical protein
MSRNFDELRTAAGRIGKDVAESVRENLPAISAASRRVIQRDLPRAADAVGKELPEVAAAIRKVIEQGADEIRRRTR